MRDFGRSIMLITYPDSLGGNLKTLKESLRAFFPGAAGSLHILPFFPSSGDRGFAPTTYDEVDPAFGDWGDIRALSDDYALMCDMMVNHISRRSFEFQDYLARGEKSPYAGMFFDYAAFFQGEPSQEELSRLYRRSDKPLYQDVTLPDGSVKRLWCSFSQEQIDLDTNSPAAREYIMRSLRFLRSQGMSAVRMDAYGYISKVRGTSCFFVEPQVWELIEEMERELGDQPLTLLPEVHADYETALKIAQKGYYTYDFVLPLTMLHTLYSGSAKALKRWFSMAPENQFTVLDTHDGIGVGDAEGILTREEADAVIRRVEPRLSYSYQPMDMSRAKYRRSYQLYTTYYSALFEDDDAYLLARAIQFMAPGIPQVYYVGMLAGPVDLDFDPADPRNINRKNYSWEEMERAARRPVVQRLLRLMRLRNTHPGFLGRLTVEDTDDSMLIMRRRAGEDWVCLTADLAARRFRLTYSDGGSVSTF